MNHSQKIEKLKSLENERDFRSFLMDLLKRIGFKDVKETHQYGNPEYERVQN